MTERFDRDELVAATRLDRAVEDVLAGAGAAGVDPETDELVERLLAAHRVQPPPALAARIAPALRRERRLGLLLRVATAVLGLLFLGQGMGNLVAGEWVARGLDTTFDSHTFFEGGVLLLALGAVVLAGALRRRWLNLAVAAGAPVGLALAVNGWSELGEFPAGGVLHLSQGAVAAVLAVLWWRSRRYVFAPGAKEGYGG